VEKLLGDRLPYFLEYYKNNLKTFFDHDNLRAIPDEKQNETDPYWNNGFLAGGDARSLYAFLGHLNPNLLIEVGVGNSTKFARKAIVDFNLKTKIVSIDPAPRAEISDLTDEYLEKSVLEVGLDIFDLLEDGDILFIDGSHITLSGTDVTHYCLNILPRIRKGVYVHIHDIFLPYEYNLEFRDRQYNEQYMVATMLLYGKSWEIVFPVCYLALNKHIEHGGGSFWMKKV
jgi:hypothetical protein